jgi:hypothetical protein
MHPIAVELSGAHIIELHMPDIAGPLRQDHASALVCSGRVEQAKLDLFGMRGEQSEVSSPAICRCPERMARSRARAHSWGLIALRAGWRAANSIEMDRMAAQDSEARDNVEHGID